MESTIEKERLAVINIIDLSMMYMKMVFEK
jgi:hypothetical protein